MAEERLRFGVAIPVCNEAQNIVQLLTRVVSAQPERILVVSDGSTDATDELVREFAARSPVPVMLQTRPERKGKADAVNRILTSWSDRDVIAMISGDTMPVDGCLERLVATFADDTVGVAAGRPVPQGPPGLPAVEVSRLLWSLHHRIALKHPKSTEITVFRKVFSRIDPHTRADEAAIEAAVISRGKRVVYVPDAVILTNAALTLRDYVRQRTSVTIGHLMLARQGYKVATLSSGERLHALVDLWREEGVKIRTLVFGALLEAGVFVAAWLRLRFGRVPDGVWSRSDSTKRAFNPESNGGSSDA